MTENILERIRNDAELVSKETKHVIYNEQRMKEIAKILTEEEMDKWTHSPVQDTCDLDFDQNPSEEYKGMKGNVRNRINFLALVDLINFASGFR